MSKDQEKTTEKKEKIPSSKAMFVGLGILTIGLSGPVAVNIHSAAHVLCAVRGECFGETRWLEGISNLPMWNMLFGIAALFLILFSIFTRHVILPKIIMILPQESDIFSREKEIMSMNKSIRTSIIIGIVSLICMLIAGAWYYVQ